MCGFLCDVVVSYQSVGVEEDTFVVVGELPRVQLGVGDAQLGTLQ